MLVWLGANAASIVILTVLLLLVSLIIRRLVLDKRAGKRICGGSCSSCGGGCSGCPMCGKCQGK